MCTERERERDREIERDRERDYYYQLGFRGDPKRGSGNL